MSIIPVVFGIVAAIIGAGFALWDGYNLFITFMYYSLSGIFGLCLGAVFIGVTACVQRRGRAMFAGRARKASTAQTARRTATPRRASPS